MSDKISQFDLNMLKIYPFVLGGILFEYFRTYLYPKYIHEHSDDYRLVNFLVGVYIGILTTKFMRKLMND